MSTTPYIVVAGVGPGTGASVARRFAKEYPVVLLARGNDKFDSLAKEINEKGGKAIGISADVSNAESLKSAFQQIEKEFPGANCAAAIFNAAGGMVRKPFLEVTEKEFSSGWEVSQKGGFFFSQNALPGLLKHAGDSSAKYPATLIFTGATAGVKANAQMATFASSNFVRCGHMHTPHCFLYTDRPAFAGKTSSCDQSSEGVWSTGRACRLGQHRRTD